MRLWLGLKFNLQRHPEERVGLEHAERDGDHILVQNGGKEEDHEHGLEP